MRASTSVSSITLKDDPRRARREAETARELAAKITEFDRVEIPPLRQRPEDIPLLVKHFASEICRELGIGELVIDINAIDVLVRQPWRENIRELKAVVDKCVLFSNEGRFMLPPELVDEKTEVVKMINNIMAGQEFILDRSLDVIEKGIIERSLDKFGFNQSKAAQFLGMTEQTFRYKLKRLGIASARARLIRAYGPVNGGAATAEGAVSFLHGAGLSLTPRRRRALSRLTVRANNASGG